MFIKTLLLFILLPLCVVAQITGGRNLQIPLTRTSSEQEYIGGEHAPLIYSDLDTLSGATSTTHWMQTGWSSTGSDLSNRNITQFNPENFTLLTHLGAWGAGDSVGIAAARFETAIDTTEDPIWNADSTNLFMANGNYNHSFYGQWMFEEPASIDTSNTIPRAYPLRVLHGGWIRFIFTKSSIQDTCVIDWNLIVEH